MRSLLFILTCLVSLETIAQTQSKEMKSLTEQAKLSCKLTTPELQQRKKTVIAQLKKLILDKVEIENGYRYKFNSTDEILDQLTLFVKTERMCCSFFTFKIEVDNTNFTCLQLSGPEGVKEFIKEEIEF